MSVKLRNSNGTFATPTKINQDESTISENVEVRLWKVGYTGCFLLKKYLCKEVCWSERYFNEMNIFESRAVPPTRWWKNFLDMLNKEEWMLKIVVFSVCVRESLLKIF